jgi:hypothetical protein
MKHRVKSRCSFRTDFCIWIVGLGVADAKFCSNP